MNLSQWLQTNIGRGGSSAYPISPYPSSSIYGECVTAASSWSLAQGGPQLLGDTAWDIWLAGNDFYDKLPVPVTLQPGDIVFYDGNDAEIGTGADGHVDVCVGSITPSGFQGADMNWNNDPNLQLVNHGYAGVAGVFRVKQGENMESNDPAVAIANTRQQQLDQIAQAVSIPNADNGIAGILGNIQILQQKSAAFDSVLSQLHQLGAAVSVSEPENNMALALGNIETLQAEAKQNGTNKASVEAYISANLS